MTKNKFFLLLTILISALVLNACVRPVTDANNSTSPDSGLLEEILTSTIIPVDTEDEEEETPEGENIVETAVQQTLEAQQTTDAENQDTEDDATPEPSPTLHIITPTATPEPTTEDTQPDETDEAEDQTEETPAPTNTPSPQPTIDAFQINPEQEFFGAHHVDSMNDPALWYDESGILPDNEYIKMEMTEGQMLVTGKLNQWDTWWISGLTLTDFYIEMVVNSGNCSGTDTYGMILRASQHGQPTHGYLIGFTCDGKVLVKRLESVSPYVAISILNPTETELVYAGANQTNIIGVAFEGDTISIYPNRYYFTTIQDAAFSYGRSGIYVQAGENGNYTFSIDEIRSWGIIE